MENKKNYPFQINKSYPGSINTSLGQDFEQMIEQANQYYDTNQIALIYKIATPVTILQTQTRNNALHISDAIFSQKSTCDYMGNYQGKAIVFEAKSTNLKTRFDLNLLKPHQLNHLMMNDQHHGISFILIYFVKLDKIYRLSYQALKTYLDTNQNAKSIPLPYIQQNATSIAYNGILDYLVNL